MTSGVAGRYASALFDLATEEKAVPAVAEALSGLADAIQYLLGFKFEKSDIDYLGEIKGNDGKRLFDAGFLKYLGGLKLKLDVDAIPEGTVVYPHEPLIRVRGSILQGQLVETALLNLMNFQSLIATKAARVCMAAQGDPVIEFGLRRAQGIDGALTASRAAYIGGCVATSNVLAGKMFGIPAKGTHAHSWVMSFENELESFDAYARVMPNNCIFLVDTYDTLEGVRHAIEVGKRLKKQGHKMVGIRLDSGDLASALSERNIRHAGVPTVKTPFGFAVADQKHLLGCHRSPSHAPSAIVPHPVRSVLG